MSSSPIGVPNVVLHLVKNVKSLHETVVLLSVLTEPSPWVPGNDALEVTPLRSGVYRVTARVGFMQSAHVPKLLVRCQAHGLDVGDDITYYLGRNVLAPAGKPRWRWRRGLFAFLVRNAGMPSKFFGLPPNRTVELGAQLDI